MIFAIFCVRSGDHSNYRLVLADWFIGAALMAAKVADFIDSGIGFGPFNCVGHAVEK